MMTGGLYTGIERSIRPCIKPSNDNRRPLANGLFRANYSEVSTFHEPTSQHGDLNILWNWNCFYIIIAQCNKALVL